MDLDTNSMDLLTPVIVHFKWGVQFTHNHHLLCSTAGKRKQLMFSQFQIIRLQQAICKSPRWMDTSFYAYQVPVHVGFSVFVHRTVITQPK